MTSLGKHNAAHHARAVSRTSPQISLSTTTESPSSRTRHAARPIRRRHQPPAIRQHHNRLRLRPTGFPHRTNSFNAQSETCESAAIGRSACSVENPLPIEPAINRERLPFNRHHVSAAHSSDSRTANNPEHKPQRRHRRRQRDRMTCMGHFRAPCVPVSVHNIYLRSPHR